MNVVNWSLYAILLIQPHQFLFFLQVNFKDFMIYGAPPCSLGLAYKSGWIENFKLALRHFIKYVKCSVDHPVVPFLHNHEGHVNHDVIQEASNNGVFPFPPHCSYRLQLLDVSFSAPLKARYNQACGSWMLSNPGKTITIHNNAE